MEEIVGGPRGAPTISSTPWPPWEAPLGGPPLDFLHSEAPLGGAPTISPRGALE